MGNFEMSIQGYKKKGKPALWTQVTGAVPTPGPVAAKKDYVLKRPSSIRHRAVRHRATDAEYRREAREFVRAAIARGETCPVVAAIEKLREGMKYGWQISDKLNEVHHIRGRGHLLLDKRFWMCCSKSGHRWIHSNVADAQARGWIARPGEWGKSEK